MNSMNTKTETPKPKRKPRPGADTELSTLLESPNLTEAEKIMVRNLKFRIEELSRYASHAKVCCDCKYWCEYADVHIREAKLDSHGEPIVGCQYCDEYGYD